MTTSLSPFTDVPLNELGEELPDIHVSIEGAWAKDGYRPGSAPPPFNTTVMGSWVQRLLGYRNASPGTVPDRKLRRDRAADFDRHGLEGAIDYGARQPNGRDLGEAVPASAPHEVASMEDSLAQA